MKLLFVGCAVDLHLLSRKRQLVSKGILVGKFLDCMCVRVYVGVVVQIWCVVTELCETWLLHGGCEMMPCFICSLFICQHQTLIMPRNNWLCQSRYTRGSEGEREREWEGGRERKREGGKRREGQREETLGERTKTHLNAFESLSITIHILHAHAHTVHTCTCNHWECH